MIKVGTYFVNYGMRGGSPIRYFRWEREDNQICGFRWLSGSGQRGVSLRIDQLGNCGCGHITENYSLTLELYATALGRNPTLTYSIFSWGRKMNQKASLIAVFTFEVRRSFLSYINFYQRRPCLSSTVPLYDQFNKLYFTFAFEFQSFICTFLHTLVRTGRR